LQTCRPARQAPRNDKPTIELINCHTLKSLDEETILKSVKKTKRVLTLEDHQIFGGLGTAVAQLLSQKYPVPIKMMGIKDRFGESARNGDELIEKFGLDAKSIVKNVIKLVRHSEQSRGI